MKDKSAPREPRTGEARFQRETRTNPRPVLSPPTKETKRSFANSETRHLHPTNTASVCISVWACERQLGKRQFDMARKAYGGGAEKEKSPCK